MLEASLEDWAIEKAEADGWFCRKMAWRGRRNAPDVFCAKEGRVVLIENKLPDEDARGTQKLEIERLREAGVEVHVCKTPTAMLRVLGVPYGV